MTEAPRRFALVLLLAKLLAGLFAWFVLRNFIELGDTVAYLRGEFHRPGNPFSSAWWMSRTGKILTESVGFGFQANLPASLWCWWGLTKAASRLSMAKTGWFVLTALLLSPSLLIWTSIHSKEAILAGGMGFIGSWYIAREKRQPLSPLDLLLAGSALLLVAFVRPVFLPALLWPLLLQRRIGGGLPTPAYTATVVVVAMALGSTVFVLFRQQISRTAEELHRHFSLQGTFTRVDAQWDGLGDLLLESPVGLVRSFVGPTLAEAYANPILTPFFIEGATLLIVLVGLVLVASIWKGRVRIARLSLLGGIILTGLIGLYPLGHFNIGSAIRYRQGILPFLILIVCAYTFDREIRWRARGTRQTASPPALPGSVGQRESAE